MLSSLFLDIERAILRRSAGEETSQPTALSGPLADTHLMSTEGSAQLLIHSTVTVIVQTITALLLWSDRVFTLRKMSIDTAQAPCPALSYSAATERALSIGLALTTLIDQLIAVVVQAITVALSLIQDPLKTILLSFTVIVPASLAATAL